MNDQQATQDLIKRLESMKEPLKAYIGESYTSYGGYQQEEVVKSENILVVPGSVGNHFESILLKKKGAPYRTIAPYSKYNDPVISDRNYGGRSRIYADSDLESQERIVEDIVRMCMKEPFSRKGSTKFFNRFKKENLSPHMVAIIVAICRVESGFNLDAAAGTTSAASLGQFVSKTGKAYGINESNVWEFSPNARALINHTLDNRDLAGSKNLGEDYIYAYHHDGPSLTYGGIEISRKHVMPQVPEIERLIKSFIG